MFSDISSRVQENLAGVRMIRAFVQEKAELRRFEELNREYIAQNIKLARIQGMFMPLLQALIGLTFLIVLWVGGYQVLHGRISLGSFVMFNTYMGMLVWPMIALGWVVNLMQRGSASLERINECCGSSPRSPRRAAPWRWHDVRGEIEFRGVTRGLSRGPRARRTSICASPPGATVAVVGHTGCGKSTLVSLIPRLLDPTAGAVLLDGMDLRELVPGGAAAPDRVRSAGDVPVQRHPRGEYRLRRGGARPRSEIRRAAEIAGLAADIEASRTATAPWWASAASRSRADRSSAPPSRGRCCGTPAS